MNVYADASMLVSVFVPDAFHDRAQRFVATEPTILVSDFAAAEFASAMARRVRTGELSLSEAHAALEVFDRWAQFRGPRLETTTGDVASAERLLRRFELNLRAPDAINICIAQRFGAALATFDVRMANAARAQGLDIVAV